MPERSPDEIENLLKRTTRLFQVGRYREALEDAKQAHDLARRNFRGRSIHADAAHAVAAIHGQLGDYGEAGVLFREALTIYRDSVGELHSEYGRTLANLATICHKAGQDKEAEELYLQALEVRRAAIGESNPVFADNLLNLSQLYKRQGRYGDAEPLIKKAVDITSDSAGGEGTSYARALLSLGELHQAMGNFTEALPLLHQAAQAMEAAAGSQHPDLAAFLTSLGEVYHTTGQYSTAESYYLDAKRIVEVSLGEGHPLWASIIGRLGNLYQETGAFEKASLLLAKSNETVQRVYGPQHASYATSLTNTAALYIRMGDFARAGPLLEKALEIRQQTVGEEHADYARAVCNLARLLDIQGNHETAEAMYWDALEILRRTEGEDDVSFANCLNDLGAACERMKRFPEAAQLYKQAAETWRLTLGEHHPAYARGLNNVASAYDSMGDYARAEPLYRKACETKRRTLGDRHPDYGGCLQNLAGVWAAMGRIDDAIEKMHEAMTVDDTMIGQVSAFASESQRLTFFDSIRDGFYSYLSLILEHAPKSSRAIATGFDLVLRRKAIGLEASAAQRDALLGGKYPALEPKLHELTELRRRIAQRTLAGAGAEGVEAHQESLTTLNAEREQLEADLARKIPEMNLSAKLQATDRQVVALHLAPDSALVEFVRFDVVDFKAIPAWDQPRWRPARYLAFVLIAGQPDSVRMIDLGLAKPIDDMIATFRRSITGDSDGRGGDGRGVPDSTQVDVHAELRRVVFDPLRDALDGKTRLVLAPEGELSQIPFEALALRRGRYLIDDYQISYLGTGRDALRLGAPAYRGSTTPIVAADPDFNLTSASVTASPSPASAGRLSRGLDLKSLAFTRLPASRKEGERIAAMLEIEPWLGGTVVEARIKGSRSPRILHLATHGFFLPDQPNQHRRREWTEMDRLSGPGMENPMLRSFLVLAGAETWRQGGSVPAEAEDGMLTAEDVSGMDLFGTDLVVLSACDTGRGEVRKGEGVFGLRRAFTIAGAKTLVMSLWTVPDEQTRVLMEEFYRRILDGQPRADALRAAQLDMKSRYPDPYFWAGFICQGDPGPLPELDRHTR